MTWDQQKLERLIADAEEESLELEYKGARALNKSPGAKKEVTKDVSAMTNAAGGVLIYGISEDPSQKRLPGEIDPVDAAQFSKEWLEHVINNIRPRIDGIVIHPVSLDTGTNDVAYVVEVPQSDCGHQASDYRYYKRYNFECQPMYDHEVRDVMNRTRHPRIEPRFRLLKELGKTAALISTVRHRYVLEVEAENTGRLHANCVNCVVDLPKVFVHSKRPMERPSPITDCSERFSKTFDNTTRDLVDVRMPSSLKGGIVKETYGPARLVPLLPARTTYLGRVFLRDDFESSIDPGHIMKWSMHADSAAPRSGKLPLKDLPVQEIQEDVD